MTTFSWHRLNRNISKVDFVLFYIYSKSIPSHSQDKIYEVNIDFQVRFVFAIAKLFFWFTVYLNLIWFECPFFVFINDSVKS